MEDKLHEHSKLVAKYMNAVVVTSYDTHDFLDYLKKDNYPDNSRYHCTNHLKYHLSWDWLIPVVRKINSMTRDDKVSAKFHRQCEANFRFNDVEGVFLAVVEFLELK